MTRYLYIHHNQIKLPAQTTSHVLHYHLHELEAEHFAQTLGSHFGTVVLVGISYAEFREREIVQPILASWLSNAVIEIEEESELDAAVLSQRESNTVLAEPTETVTIDASVGTEHESFPVPTPEELISDDALVSDESESATLGSVKPFETFTPIEPTQWDKLTAKQMVAVVAHRHEQLERVLGPMAATTHITLNGTIDILEELSEGVSNFVAEAKAQEDAKDYQQQSILDAMARLGERLDSIEASQSALVASVDALAALVPSQMGASLESITHDTGKTAYHIGAIEANHRVMQERIGHLIDTVRDHGKGVTQNIISTNSDIARYLVNQERQGNYAESALAELRSRPIVRGFTTFHAVCVGAVAAIVSLAVMAVYFAV